MFSLKYYLKYLLSLVQDGIVFTYSFINKVCFLFPGVLLPVHCVCGLHHAALLHEVGHYCQWYNLSLAHGNLEHLSDLHCHRSGTSSLAGKTSIYPTM